MDEEASCENNDDGQPSSLKNIRSIYSASWDDDDSDHDDSDDDEFEGDLREKEVTPKKRGHKVKLEAGESKTKMPINRKTLNSPGKPTPFSGENFLDHINLITDNGEPQTNKAQLVKPKPAPQPISQKTPTNSVRKVTKRQSFNAASASGQRPEGDTGVFAQDDIR